MNMSVDDHGLLRKFIFEDLKNVRSKHEPATSDSKRVLRLMHDAPGVIPALQEIDNPRELAAVIEALIDACPVVRKGDVLSALSKVTSHERKTRR